MIETDIISIWTSGMETTIKIAAILGIVCLVAIYNISR